MHVFWGIRGNPYETVLEIDTEKQFSGIPVQMFIAEYATIYMIPTYI